MKSSLSLIHEEADRIKIDVNALLTYLIKENHWIVTLHRVERRNLQAQAQNSEQGADC